MRNLILKIVQFFDALTLRVISRRFIDLISRQNYAHNLSWNGVPIFQTPTDLYLYQLLISTARPNIIIETGVAKGGSVLFACQMLDNLYGKTAKAKWKVVCCDVNSLEEAKFHIDNHGYSQNVIFFQGDSVSDEFVALVREQLKALAAPKVLVSLDSDHTEKHVFQEMMTLSPFVSVGSFAIVWDSRLGDLSRLTNYLRPRAWNKKHHAGTGVTLFLDTKENRLNFQNCNFLEKELLITGTKNGILRKIR